MFTEGPVCDTVGVGGPWEMGPSERKWAYWEEGWKEGWESCHSSSLCFPATTHSEQPQPPLTGPKARSHLTLNTNLQSYEPKQAFSLLKQWPQVLYCSSRRLSSTMCTPHHSLVTPRESWEETLHGKGLLILHSDYREHWTHPYEHEFIIFSVTPLPWSHKWRFMDP